ncbi:MAG: sulfite exporter TauE/SafE family protein [Anaerolineales bacterium]
MTTLIVVGLLVLIVAVAMTMVGKGGGNFYVVILAIASIPMHEAAATGQFVLLSASVAAMLIFQKNRSVLWPLAVFIGIFTALAALGGGYFSHYFSGLHLKLVFGVMLVLAGAVMLLPVSEFRSSTTNKTFGIIALKSGDSVYRINLWIALPTTVLTGFAAGMVGVSGGSFLVPLMVLACGVPMHAAVGTAATLIAVTAAMGFAGHALQGDFNPSWAIPLAIVAVVGGFVGGKLSLKTKPKHLKKLFAFTNWLAAAFMFVNVLYTQQLLF